MLGAVKPRLTRAFAVFFSLFSPFVLPAIAGDSPHSPFSPAEDIGRTQAAVLSLGRRFENGSGEAGAFALIEELSRKAGAELSRTNFDSLPDGHSYSSILEARFSGQREDRLVFIVPLDQHRDGPANEGNGALSLALAEIERIGAERAEGTELPISLSFLFLSAERRGRYADGEAPGLGSEAWIAENASSTVPLAVVYLAFDTLPGRISLLNTGRGILSPVWHYEAARQALDSSGFGYELDGNRMQIHRLGFADRPGPLDPFLKASIPALELKGMGKVNTSPLAAFESFDHLVKALLAQNSDGFSKLWDRNYLSFQLGSRSFVVRETPYIAFLLAFCALVTAGILVFTVVRRAATKLFLKRLPAIMGQVLAIYCSTLAVFLAGGLASDLESLLFGSSGFWQLAPRAFLLARVAGAFFLFLAALSLLVERRLLSANPYFYEFAALLCLGGDILVFTALMPPLAFYFVWAFAFVGLSLIARKPWMSLVSSLLMYAPLILLGREVLAEPEYSLYGRLVLPGLAESALMAAALLPLFIFAASPLLFFAPGGKRARAVAACLCVALATLFEGGAILHALSPSALASAPFELSERLDAGKGSFSASLKGSRRVGTISLLRGQSSLVFSSRRDTARAEGRDDAKWLRFSEERSSFLGRSVLHLRLDFTRKPDFLSLRLLGTEELRLYDCSLPYHLAIDGKSAEIFVGAAPPEPFELELTVPAGFVAKLQVMATYLEPLVPYYPPEGQSLKPGSYELDDSFDIGGANGPGLLPR